MAPYQPRVGRTSSTLMRLLPICDSDTNSCRTSGPMRAPTRNRIAHRDVARNAVPRCRNIARESHTAPPAPRRVSTIRNPPRSASKRLAEIPRQPHTRGARRAARIDLHDGAKRDPRRRPQRTVTEVCLLIALGLVGSAKLSILQVNVGRNSGRVTEHLGLVENTRASSASRLWRLRNERSQPCQRSSFQRPSRA
jgi:hypothetical protein